MRFWSAVKKKLRKIIPADRVYLDKKFKEKDMQDKKIREQQEKDFQEIDKKIQELDRKLQLLDNSLKASGKSQDKLFKEVQKNREAGEKASEELRQYVEQEFRRRDDWGKRAAEIRHLAGERPVWVIKCPAPEGPKKVRWGDYAYALSLKRYLDRLGIYTVIDMKEDWDCETEADVVLVLRGCHFYRPDRRNKKCLYIMWNISHPDMITEEEYELYDVVCICSRYYAQKMADKVKVPVIPLLQCTDTELFYPKEEQEEVCENDFVFIGNTRGIARQCVLWAIQDKLPLKIWGTGWVTMFPEHKDLIQSGSIENKKIPDVYRASKATLNDHWKDMLDDQFVNNRIFDAVACGLPVISDSCEELRNIFPDAVLYYETKEDFDRCIRTLETDYASVKEKVLAQWPLIKEKYSFEARARELVEIAEKYGKKDK